MARPINQYRDKGISIAKWAGREPGSFYFSLQKTYKDKTSGEYKETKTYFENDLSTLKKLIQQALSEVEHAPETTTTEESDPW